MTFEGLTFDELADVLGCVVQQHGAANPRHIDLANNVRLYEDGRWTWFAATDEG